MLLGRSSCPGSLIPKVVPLVSLILLSRIDSSLTFPTIVFCLPQCDSAFLMCRKAGRVLLPMQVACFKMYFKETSRFSGIGKYINVHDDLGATFQIIFRCIHHFEFFLSSRLSAVPGRSSLLATIHRLQRCCLHGALLYLSHLDRSATRKLLSFELKVSRILRPWSSLASFKTRLKSTSTSSGPNNSSNASTCTFTLRLLSRNCFVLAMIAFFRIPSSSFLFVPSVVPHKGGARILHK